MHGIIIPKRRSAAMTPVVAKVAAGAAEHILIARVANLTRYNPGFKRKGLWIAGGIWKARPGITTMITKVPWQL